ncbi:hypothetical protein K3495_g2396 [Podosphaera aphanis]|nr:hypothetical protein K3495_g2396 [Podosphaera aphanis]
MIRQHDAGLRNQNADRIGNSFGSSCGVHDFVMESVSTDNFPEPNGKIVLEEYLNEAPSRSKEISLLNPVSELRSQGSSLVDINDPIQIHLLLETALSDSKEFPILSQKELDDLKRQCQDIVQRLEQTRQNLAIQSKYRDATLSVSKLYSSNSSDGSLDQMLPVNGRTKDVRGQEVEKERTSIERKCESLAAELFRLEKQLMVPQGKILKHTAGILQITHKSTVNSSGESNSPENLYMSSDTLGSSEDLKYVSIFDENSLYRELEGFDDSLNNSYPPKFPSFIKEAEKKIEELSNKIRQIIIKIDPDRDKNFDPPPLSSLEGGDRAQILQTYLDYIERSISTIDLNHEQLIEQQNSAAARFDALADQKDILQRQITQQRELHNESVTKKDAQIAENAMRLAEMADLKARTEEQVTLVQEQLNSALERLEMTEKKEVSREISSRDNDLTNQERIREAEERAHEAEIRAKKLEESGSAAIMELEARRKDIALLEEQLKSMESDLATAQIELQAKVSESEAQIKSLKQELATASTTKTLPSVVDQKIIDNEKELNTVMREKDLKLAQTERQLNAVIMEKEMILEEKEREINSIVMEKDMMLAEKERQLNAVIMEKEMILSEKGIEINEAIKEREKLLAEKDKQLYEVVSQKDLILAEKANAIEVAIKEKNILLSDKEREIDEAQIDIARLQTEVTIAKAELESAYGSRSQRAARVAANPAIQKEIDELTKTNNALIAEITSLKSQPTQPSSGMEEELNKLRTELAEIVGEYELMTKANIEWEKEREQLEETIDMLREAKEDIETQLSEEKVRWLGARSPGADILSPSNTSTTILKNEFKKMMRDTRSENARALKAEQLERRRLEDELRALKRAQIVGKSR